VSNKIPPPRQPDFEVPALIHADRVVDQGVRLPYLKFPRNPID
jgi:hypothetical protein